MVVLIVEPSTAERESLANILNGLEYDCRYFGLISELENFLFEETTRPNATGIQAIMLPMDPSSEGIELLKKIKRDASFTDIPILVTSAFNQPESIQIAFAVGASDYVEKPFNQIELKARLRSCVRLKYEIERRKARENELLESARQLSDLTSQLMNLSLMDTLTGIPNRRHLDITLEREIRRAQRSKIDLAFCLLDIDCFKLYNDNYGHRAGDKALRAVAQAIRTAVSRPADLVARYGGEEFAVVLPDTDLEGALSVMERVRQQVVKQAIPHRFSKVTDVVTVSIGVSLLDTENAIDMESLIESADKALYVAKAKGRNRVTASNKDQKIFPFQKKSS